MSDFMMNFSQKVEEQFPYTVLSTLSSSETYKWLSKFVGERWAYAPPANVAIAEMEEKRFGWYCKVAKNCYDKFLYRFRSEEQRTLFILKYSASIIHE